MAFSGAQGGLGEVLGGARALVDLETIVKSTLERIHAEFGGLLHTSAASNDEGRCDRDGG